MEKRKYFRFNVDLEVKYRVLESLRPYKATFTEDMCEGGIRINLPAYIEPETRLELTVRLAGETQPIMAIGRVAWVKKDPCVDNYTTGIHLVYINEGDRERFYKHAIL